MSGYIDTDAFIKYCEEHWIPLNVDAVNAQPKADVREVVHGEWIYEMGKGQHCSICGKGNIWKFNYCPNCGAKMDERRINEGSSYDEEERD